MRGSVTVPRLSRPSTSSSSVTTTTYLEVMGCRATSVRCAQGILQRPQDRPADQGILHRHRRPVSGAPSSTTSHRSAAPPWKRTTTQPSDQGGAGQPAATVHACHRGDRQDQGLARAGRRDGRRVRMSMARPHVLLTTTRYRAVKDLSGERRSSSISRRRASIQGQPTPVGRTGGGGPLLSDPCEPPQGCDDQPRRAQARRGVSAVPQG